MNSPEFTIGIATDGEDSIVGIKPPVDNTFREGIYDILDSQGLVKEIIVRGGSFFETRQSAKGQAYSELRVSSTALDVASVRLINLAHECADVLEEQGKTVEVSHFLRSSHRGNQLFGPDNQ